VKSGMTCFKFPICWGLPDIILHIFLRTSKSSIDKLNIHRY